MDWLIGHLVADTLLRTGWMKAYRRYTLVSMVYAVIYVFVLWVFTRWGALPLLAAGSWVFVSNWTDFVFLYVRYAELKIKDDSCDVCAHQIYEQVRLVFHLCVLYWISVVVENHPSIGFYVW